MEIGESPYVCACREAEEEIGIKIQPSDLHLFGLISEHGYQAQTHWLIFLFEIKTRLTQLPPVHREGKFGFFRRDELASLKIPQSDLEQIWPLFWKYRHGFFAAHCHCHADGRNDWVTVRDSPSLDLTTGMTIEAWVYPTKAGGWRTLAIKETTRGLAYALYPSGLGGFPTGHASTPTEAWASAGKLPLK